MVALLLVLKLVQFNFQGKSTPGSTHTKSDSALLVVSMKVVPLLVTGRRLALADSMGSVMMVKAMAMVKHLVLVGSMESVTMVRHLVLEMEMRLVSANSMGSVRMVKRLVLGLVSRMV